MTLLANSENFAFKYIFPIIKSILWFVFIISLLSFVHWGLVQFMATYCSPWGIYGPIINIVTIGSPLCQSVNYLQLKFTEHYMTIWGAAIASISTWFLANFKVKD